MTQPQSSQATATPNTSSAVVFSAASLLAIAYLIYNMLPVVLGAAADTLGLNEQQIGYLGSIYMAGSTVANVSAIFWVRNLSWRRVVFFTSLLVIGSYCLAGSMDYRGLLAMFLVLGAANGIIVSCVLTCLGDSESPDRSFGYGIGFQVTLAGVAAFLLPILVVPEWGFQGVMFTLGGIVLLSLLLIKKLPATGGSTEAMPTPKQTETNGSSTSMWWGVAGMMLYFIGQSGVWAFLDRIGVQGGFDNETLGAIFGITLLLSAGGAFLASAIGTRFGRNWPIIAATVALVVSVIMLPLFTNPWLYGFAVLIFTAAWNFVLPFQMTIITEGDSTGNFTPLIPACQLLGSAIGPAIAGNIIFEGDYTYVYWLSIATAIGSTVIFVTIENFLIRQKTPNIAEARAT